MKGMDEKMIKKIISSYYNMTFDRKMRFFLTVVIFLSSMVILMVSTWSAVSSITRQSRKMAEEQVKTLTNSFENELSTYKTMTIALQINSSIQDYLSFNDKKDEDYSSKATEAFNIINNTMNMNDEINFIGVVNNKFSDFLYKGDLSLSLSKFDKVYEKDFKIAMPALSGTMRINYNNAYFDGEMYTLNIYQPIYSTTSMINEEGLLVLNIDNNLLNQLNIREKGDLNTDIYLMDTTGKVLTASERHKREAIIENIRFFKGTGGTFSRSGYLYIYQKINAWNYFVVSQIPLVELYGSSLRTMFVLAGVIFAMTIIALLLSRTMIRKSYEPMEKVISKMDCVSAGKINVRINSENMPPDFKTLALGFNEMMDEIMKLMEEVKLEQHQLEQIKFNALQSQIQPHFLYNTLDCIHWQAIVQGNKEVSVLVKALAQYYRICLSKGKDIITLKEEIEHIRNYLVIQNMRYDNIIEAEIAIDEELLSVQLPKMTLQPLVENSIYHGLKAKDGMKGKITVSARISEDKVFIIIEDTGTGMSKEEIDEMNASITQYDDSFGYGVRNVNRRIELIYGAQYGLHYKQNDTGGVTVEITLPTNHEPEYKEILSCAK